jgi:hypothetical protein
MTLRWLVGTLALASSALITGACSDPTEGCDPCRTDAIVYGVVTDATGAPVSHVRVEVAVSAASCGEDFIQHGGTQAGEPWTESDGRYRATVISLYAPFTATCAEVTGNSHADPMWPITTVTSPISLELRERNTPLDSVRVDVTLRSQAQN